MMCPQNIAPGKFIILLMDYQFSFIERIMILDVMINQSVRGAFKIE